MNKHPCPHFTYCSGCETVLDVPPPIWEVSKKFFEKFNITAHLHTSSGRHWRMKAKLAVQGSKENLRIGLYRKGTHEVYPIPECLVHHPSINQAVHAIRDTLLKSELTIYDEKTHKGELRYLQLFVERETGLVQLGLIINGKAVESSIKDFCEKLIHTNMWHSIWVNFQEEKTNRILGSRWERIWGEEWLFQKLGKERVAFHPGAFSQAHLELFEQMLITIQKWTPPNSDILELFAGIGIIGRSLELDCKSLVLIENNLYAQISYNKSYNVSVKCQYLLQNAYEIENLSPFDVVIVDPPRKGLSGPLLKALCSSKELTLIYVSCGWESFQSDAEMLISSGWKLKKAEGFLLFPGTNQVETLAYFEI